MKIRLFAVALFVVGLGSSTAFAGLPNITHKVFEPVLKHMLAAGIDTTFAVDIIEDNNTEFLERMVRINVVGTVKPADYSQFLDQETVGLAKPFYLKHDSVFTVLEEKYGVPGHTIAALMWIETRHGGYTGYNNVASVYLSLAMANEPKYIQMNIDTLIARHKGSKSELDRLKDKIRSRAKSKARWAVEQLAALEKMHAMYHTSITSIEGSWAGAFGMSQFIPSSYVSYAIDGNGDGVVDLFNEYDAMHSVANYLKKHGWGSSKAQQEKAVYAYNRSKKYVGAVLGLAELLRKSSQK